MNLVKILPLTALLALSACDSAAKKEVSLDTQEQKISYLMGLDSGKNILSMDMGFDQDAFLSGQDAGLTDTLPSLSEEQIDEAVAVFRDQMMAKEQAMQKEQEGMATLQSETNAIEGAEFLALNGAKEGVTTTASGLQYRVLTAGTGPTPTAESTVEVHYAGRLLDGNNLSHTKLRWNATLD